MSVIILVRGKFGMGGTQKQTPFDQFKIGSISTVLLKNIIFHLLCYSNLKKFGYNVKSVDRKGLRPPPKHKPQSNSNLAHHGLTALNETPAT